MRDKERTEELVVVDISRYKKIKTALKDSETRYCRLFESIPIGIFRFSADGKILDANPALLKMLGYSSSAEFDQKNLGKKNKNILKILSEFCNKIESRNEFRSFDLTWRKKDNTPLFIRVNARIVSASDNNVLFYEGMVEDISERKQAESQRETALGALKKSSQLLSDTGEMAEVGGWELDLSTQEVSWTEEVGRIHGVEPGYRPKLQEALNFYPPEFRPTLEAALKKAAETGEPYDLESQFIPQGSKDKIWVRSLGRAVYSDGKITKLAGTFQNIDKYKRTEEALRESEEKYRSVFNNFVDLYYQTDMQGLITNLSPSCFVLSGYQPEELIGCQVLDFYTDPKQRKAFLEKLFREGVISDYEITLLHRDGRHIPASVSSHLIKNEQGDPKYIEGIIHDISERKQAESQREAALEALRRTEENFRRSLDESPLGVRIVTAKGKTIYANRALLDFYDYNSIAELNQIPLRKRYTPKSYEEYKKRRKAREQGRLGPSEYEVSIVRKNGDFRQLQVFRKAILWNGAKQFQMLYRDITESKQWLEKLKGFEKTIQGQKMLLDQQSSSVEELIERLTRSREELGASYRELKVKKDDLVRSEKLAFTGRMAAGIAHEIRNPLTNVILSIQQLKKDEKIEPEVLKYAEIVERNTKRMEYLITELLNCARPIKLNRQPGDIHLLIKDILNVHKVRLKTQRIKVLQNLTSHRSTLLFDKEQLGRVFLNLMANAIDAMRKGGKLSIATKSEKKKFLIKIQDNGSGIPEKNMIKLFDPFFSTKKGGAGLGLSICQNIVSSHGGLIEVESVWRKGSVFSVSLPFESKPLDRKENMAGKS